MVNEAPAMEDNAGRLVLDRTLSITFPDFEYSAHYMPKSMIREVRQVFAGVDVSQSTIVIPTCQKSTVILTNWGPEQAAEKDRLLERFFVWAKAMCDHMKALGHWADFTDPCSGLPYNGPSGGTIFPDVDCFERLLRYDIDASMGCRIMSHPEWRFASYPATAFTNAPQDVLLSWLKVYNGV